MLSSKVRSARGKSRSLPLKDRCRADNEQNAQLVGKKTKLALQQQLQPRSRFVRAAISNASELLPYGGKKERRLGRDKNMQRQLEWPPRDFK